ncbi:MAG: anaerobic ribonucleoside-triphosphate reductase activating protein, partial [Deltaproteobacteria bacterium]
MKIGGIQKVSLADYPSKICATVFTQGCNFRCPYCHNPELVDSTRFANTLSQDAIMNFLSKRKIHLDAVNITGGEPTIQEDIVDFCGAIKKLGFLVKIDTNGSMPLVLKKLIQEEVVDFVAMDIKAPLKRYPEVSCVKNIDIKLIEESVNIIKTSNKDYEFRTTVVSGMFTKEDFDDIGVMLKYAKRYVLQRFVPSKILDESYLRMFPPNNEEMLSYQEQMNAYVGQC